MPLLSINVILLNVEQEGSGLNTKEAGGLGANASPVEAHGARAVTAGQMWQMRALIEGFRGYRHVASTPPQAVIVWFKCGPWTLSLAALCLSGIHSEGFRNLAFGSSATVCNNLQFSRSTEVIVNFFLQCWTCCAVALPLTSMYSNSLNHYIILGTALI